MTHKRKLLALSLMLAMVVSISPLTFADDDMNTSPIDNVLMYKNSLKLTDNQVAKLEKFNCKLCSEIIETRSKLALCKYNIDRYMAGWAVMQDTITCSSVDEYYNLQAKLKQLELEAMLKINGALTLEQMNHYSELATTGALVIDMDSE